MMNAKSTCLLLLALSLPAQAVNEIGYKNECRLDSECRATSDLTDICCAKLVYSAFGADVEKRVCLARSDMDSANGEYKYEDITTTEAYCDSAMTGFSLVMAPVVASALLALM